MDKLYGRDCRGSSSIFIWHFETLYKAHRLYGDLFIADARLHLKRRCAHSAVPDHRVMYS